jgi:hypothetical protein
MDVGSPFVAYLQSPTAVDPRQCPLHNPSVPSQPLTGLDAAPSDARGYTPLPERLPAAGEVVALIGMELLRALAWSATGLADRLDSVHNLLQDLRVVDVGGRMHHRERDAPSVDHNMALRALFAFIRRVRASLFAPPGAATLAESKEALSQSISSAWSRRSSSALWSRSHTPASCHSLRRRQQVIPEPHPIS